MAILKGRFCGVWTFILLLCCGVVGSAQEKKAQPALTGLALEIVTQKGAPAGYLTVPGEMYGGNFPRISSWKEPTGGAGEQTSIKLHDELEGDAVRIKVSVQKGRFKDSEVLIGNYLLTVGQSAVIEDMASYGYQPMEISVVRLNTAPPSLPTGTSKAASVEVLDVVERQCNFPCYSVVIHNRSFKDVNELVITTSRAGAMLTIQWEQKPQNLPLIKAGDTLRVIVHSEASGQKSADVYIPSSPDNIAIATAVFSDKSYEGEAIAAVRYIARLAGQKIQAERAIALLESSSDGELPGPDGLLANLQTQVTALSREAPPEAMKQVLTDFAGNTTLGPESLKYFVEAGLNDVRKELLKDIQEFSQVRDRNYDRCCRSRKLGKRGGPQSII
jgi:hypothetical protein